MTLHTPVQIFCRRIAPRLGYEENYGDWFASAINKEELKGNTLYTWVETRVYHEQGNIERHIDYAVVAPLTSYSAWSAGTFWKVIRSVRTSCREYYHELNPGIDE